MIVYGLFLILLSVCYSLPQDPTSLPLLDTTDPPKIDIQTQIYIVSGTLGGIILLLILLVLALSVSIARIKDQLQGGRQSKYELQHRPAENVSSPRGYGASDHVSSSYVNNAFNGGHEMEERAVDSKTTADRMGYEMYNGRSNAENRSSLAPYHTSTSPKNNYTSHSYHHYDEDGLDYKRDKHDYRIEKSRKQTRSSPERRNEVHVETNGSEEEYRSKAQKFVERNKEVIDSGAMFQMQPVVSKAKLRNSGANNAAPIPRARVQNDNTTSFQNDNRDDYDRRNQNSRYSKQSNHQLRLEEGVSPVRSHDNIDQHDGRQQYQRNRYRE